MSAYMYISYNRILNRHNPYTQPFSKELWRAIFTFIILTGIFSTLINYLKNKIAKSTFPFLSAFYHPTEAFMNQYGGEEPRETPIRITMITTRLAALFIVPAYSAFILTFILYPDARLPFTDIKGLVQDGSYKIAFLKNQNWDNWFRGTNDYWSKLAYKNYSLEPDEMPTTYDELFEKLCNDPKKLFFLILETDIYFNRCKVVKTPNPITIGWWGYFLRKSSPYKNIFNRIFKKFHSAGILDKFNKEDYMMQFLFKKFDDDATNEPKPVAGNSITSVIKIMLWFYIISVITLIIECLKKRRRLILNKICEFVWKYK